MADLYLSDQLLSNKWLFIHFQSMFIPLIQSSDDIFIEILSCPPKYTSFNVCVNDLIFAIGGETNDEDSCSVAKGGNNSNH